MIRRVLAVILAICAGAITSAATPALRVSEVTLFGNMECFKVETPHATYLYGKIGAGFASILDADGHDWISYRHGGAAAGEFRGLPKCGQPVKYFHCGYGFGAYKTENTFVSTVTIREPGHVRIESVTKRGDAAGSWDFFPTHATFTITKIAGGRYWFIYEGNARRQTRRRDRLRNPPARPPHAALAPVGRESCRGSPSARPSRRTAFSS